MKLRIPKGTTSKRLGIFIPDSSQTDGRGLAGLAYNSAGLSAAYWREDEGNADATTITLATATRGTFTSGGFKEKDSTKMPGAYEVGIPDAALAAGADWVIVMYKGATNMPPITLEIQLIEEAGVRKNQALANFMFHMTSSADHVASKTGLVNGDFTKQVSLDGGAFSSLSGSISEVASGLYKISLTAAELNADIVTLRFAASGADTTTLTIKTTNA